MAMLVARDWHTQPAGETASLEDAISALQGGLTERYLNALAEDWQNLTINVHGEKRLLPLERVFVMLQAQPRSRLAPLQPPYTHLDSAVARLQDADPVPQDRFDQDDRAIGGEPRPSFQLVNQRQSPIRRQAQAATAWACL